MFIGLIISLVNGSNHTKYALLTNNNLRFYRLKVKSDRCVLSCNTINDLSNKVCVPNKTQYLNIHVFNLITEKNESKTLTKDTSCKCKCKFDGRKIKSEIMINVEASAKNIIYVKKIIFGILRHVVKMENI